jgi:SMI1/KNR4 family protein SUKH-1
MDTRLSKLDEKLSALGLRPLPFRSSTFQPASEAEVSQLEKLLGTRFPEGYRHFLLKYGNSYFEAETSFLDLEANPQPFIGEFYGAESLLKAIDDYSEELPAGIIPIGDDGGGNLYCLGLTGNDRNKVYYHNHCIGWRSDAAQYLERGEEVPAGIEYQTVELLADSFEGFIDSMFIDPEP